MIEPGQTFGRLVVLRRSGNDNHGQARYVCLCNCGNEKYVRGSSLLAGDTQSCGCINRERLNELNQINDVREIKLRNKELVNKIRQLAKQSGTGPVKWVEEVLNDWIFNHRSNKEPIRSEENITEEVGDEEYAIGR